MPLVPIPRDLSVPRLAGLCIILALTALAAPAIIFWSLAAPQKGFHLELLQELRGWTAELVNGPPGAAASGRTRSRTLRSNGQGTTSGGIAATETITKQA
jgi:hypothetical protein